jgi:hypothetical protein
MLAGSMSATGPKGDLVTELKKCPLSSERRTQKRTGEGAEEFPDLEFAFPVLF